MELLTKLGVDWKLLLAQVANFAILLGVLTYFVYRPLIDLLDARRKNIAKAMEDVKSIERQKQELDVFRLSQMKKIDEETGKFLERAKSEAETARQKMLLAAQEEVEMFLVRGRKQLADERAQVMTEVQTTLTSLILRVAEKVLQREFTPEDQRRLVASLGSELPSRLS